MGRVILLWVTMFATERNDVGRQYPESLQQADCETNGNNKRNDKHKLANDTRQQHQWQKCRHGGGYGGCHRLADFLDGIDGCIQGVHAALQTVIHGLHHHHGVINQHTQYDNDTQ